MLLIIFKKILESIVIKIQFDSNPYVFIRNPSTLCLYEIFEMFNLSFYSILCCNTSHQSRCVLARFITEMTGPRHNNKDNFCTMFSILKALCACTLPPLTCRCSKVDVSQIHMVNPVNDLKIAHIIACLGIFLWVQNLKLDI